MEAWRKLYQAIGIAPIPDTLKECKETIRVTHVNIVDLVDSKRTGTSLKVFESEKELSVYTQDTGKYFPRENAYAGGLLRFLLRKILHPPEPSEVPGGSENRGGRGDSRGSGSRGGRGYRGNHRKARRQQFARVPRSAAA